MSEQLLTILKICLLALLYLFFLRVLRAVWAEVSGPRVVTKPAAPRPTKAKRRPRRSGAPQLRVLEPAADRGRGFDIGQELTLGRAATCSVTLDDTFISQHHAKVYAQGGQYLVEDLGSTNGTYLNREKVTGPMVFSRGDRIQIGNTVLELT